MQPSESIIDATIQLEVECNERASTHLPTPTASSSIVDADRLYALSAEDVERNAERLEDDVHTNRQGGISLADDLEDATAKQPRRQFLRNVGIGVAAATVTGHRLSPKSIHAAADEKVQHRAMRSSNPSVSTDISTSAGLGLPVLPSPTIIALNRMGYGPRPGDVRDFLALGGTPDEQLAAYVEQQINPASIDDSECDAKLAEQGFVTLEMSSTQLWTTYVKPTTEDPEYDRYKPVREVSTATFLRGLYSKRQLLEIMADFWHNHFNVFGWDYWIGPTFSQYDRDVIRANAFGNFRQMLEDVAKSPAMLYYLDNQSNEGGSPNENYARELFELHGMGAENYLGIRDPNDSELVDENGDRIGYIDADVYGSTTCFTGWRVNSETGEFEFDDSRHFPFQKIVLGKIFPSFQGIKDGQDVLDLIANHPGTARYISRKLCRRLVADEPDETLVQSAAEIFHAQKDAPNQIQQVVKHILLSEEFKLSWGKKIKRPLELTLSLLRSANADFEATQSFYWWYEQMGQRLFYWRPPDGYPDSRLAWSSTMPMVQRWRFINKLILWGYDDDSERRRLSLQSQTPSSVKTSKQIVDFWANRILGRTLPLEEYQPILDYLAQGRNPDYELPTEQIQERLPYAVGLIYMSPTFQWK